jgi:hypothetical protein
MAEGHDQRWWSHTSALLAQIAEPYRDSKEHPKPFSPAEFNPYGAQEPRPRGIPLDVDALHALMRRTDGTSK